MNLVYILKSMRKLLCMLLMCWLPFSMAVAQAMSAQMILKKQVSQDAQQFEVRLIKSCHSDATQKDGDSSQCSQCVACALANTSATIKNIGTFKTQEETSAKYKTFHSTLVSIQLAPAFKPPIFN